MRFRGERKGGRGGGEDVVAWVSGEGRVEGAEEYFVDMRFRGEKVVEISWGLGG